MKKLVFICLAFLTACSAGNQAFTAASLAISAEQEGVTEEVTVLHHLMEAEGKIYLLRVGTIYHRVRSCTQEEMADLLGVNQLVTQNLANEEDFLTLYGDFTRGADLSCAEGDLDTGHFWDAYLHVGDGLDDLYVPSGVEGAYYFVKNDQTCLARLRDKLFKVNDRLSYGLYETGVPPALHKTISLLCEGAPVDPSTYKVYSGIGNPIASVVLVVRYFENNKPTYLPIYAVNGKQHLGADLAANLQAIKSYFGIMTQGALEKLPPRVFQNSAFLDLCLPGAGETCAFQHRKIVVNSEGFPESVLLSDAEKTATRRVTRTGSRYVLWNDTDPAKSEIDFVGCDQLLGANLGLQLKSQLNEAKWQNEQFQELVQKTPAEAAAAPAYAGKRFVCPPESQVKPCSLVIGSSPGADLPPQMSYRKWHEALKKKQVSCAGNPRLEIQLDTDVAVELDESLSYLDFGRFSSVRMFGWGGSRVLNLVEKCSLRNPCRRRWGENLRSVFQLSGDTGLSDLSIESVQFDYGYVLEPTTPDTPPPANPTLPPFNLIVKLINIQGKADGKVELLLRNSAFGASDGTTKDVTSYIRAKHTVIYSVDTRYSLSGEAKPIERLLSLESSFGFFYGTGAERLSMTSPAGTLSADGPSNVMLVNAELSSPLRYDVSSRIFVLHSRVIGNPAAPLLTATYNSAYAKVVPSPFNVNITGQSEIEPFSYEKTVPVVKFEEPGSTVMIGKYVRLLVGGAEIQASVLARQTYCTGQGNLKILKDGVTPPICKS